MRSRLAILLASAVVLLLASSANAGWHCGGCGIYDDNACPSDCVSCATRSKCCDCTEGYHGCLTSGCPSGYSHFVYASQWGLCNYDGCRRCLQKNTGRCNTCKAGKYRADVGSVDECRACAPGKHNPSNGGTCINCPIGKYQTKWGQTSCPQCEVGRYNQLQGRAGPCWECYVGMYQPSAGQSYCHNCAPGKFQGWQGKTSCPDCVAGTYTNTGWSRCADCAAGTFSDDAAPSCTACSAGTFTPYTAQKIMCQKCVGGRYMPYTGATKCFDCTRGKFSTEEAQSSCVSPPCSSNCLAGAHIGYTSMIRGEGCSLKSRYDELVSDYDRRCANGKPAMQDGCKIICQPDWYDDMPQDYYGRTHFGSDTIPPTKQPTSVPTTKAPTTRPTGTPTKRPTQAPTDYMSWYVIQRGKMFAPPQLGITWRWADYAEDMEDCAKQAIENESYIFMWYHPEGYCAFNVDPDFSVTLVNAPNYDAYEIGIHKTWA